MTKAHVPPQCAGNTMVVARTALVDKGDRIVLGRSQIGGIHFYGLCVECNGAAGVFDREYKVLSDAMAPMWAQSWELALPHDAALPDVVIKPADIARSILLGMCAVTPILVDKWPDLISQLMDPTSSPRLPVDIRLRLAQARGKTARVSGPFAGFYVAGPKHRRGPDGRPMGVHSVASVYFPPLAWELVYAGPTTLDADGWADVSDWVAIPVGEQVRLRTLVDRLPYAAHPAHNPGDADYWIELTSDQISPVSECVNIVGHEPDPITAALFNQRVHISTDELDRSRARRRGY